MLVKGKPLECYLDSTFYEEKEEVVHSEDRAGILCLSDWVIRPDRLASVSLQGCSCPKDPSPHPLGTLSLPPEVLTLIPHRGTEQYLAGGQVG